MNATADHLESHAFAEIDERGILLEVSPEWRHLANSARILFGKLTPGENFFEHPNLQGETPSTKCLAFADDLRLIARQERHEAMIRYPASTPTGTIWVELLAKPCLAPKRGAILTQRVIDLTDSEFNQQTQVRAAMLESLGEAVLAVDFEANITFINRQAEELYGFTLAEVYGEHAAKVTLADISDDEANDVLSRLRAGESWTGEMRVTTRDGRRFPARVMTSPIWDERRNAIGIITLLHDITEIEEAAAALREGEIRYRDLFEASPLPAWVYDIETLQFLMVNRMATEIYGYSEEEFLGMTIRDIRPEEDLGRLEHAIGGLGTVGRTLGQWRHKTKSGDILEVEVSSDRMTYKGRMARFAVAKDVTESQAAAAALQRKTRQQAAVAELGREAISTSDPASLMSRAVEIVAEIFSAELSGILQLQPDGDNLRLVAGHGWQQDRIGTDITSVSTGAQASYTLRTAAPVIVTDLPSETRFENKHLLAEHDIRSGISIAILVDHEPWGIFAVHTTRSQTFNEEDLHFYQSVANIIAVAIQRHRADEAIRQSQERFQYVALATADAIWDWDLVNDRLWWSDGMYHLFGFLPSELEPGIDSWTTRVHPEDVQRVTNEIYSAIESQEESWSDEYRFIRKDGSYAYVQDRGFVIRNAEGAPIRMVGGMADITAKVMVAEQQKSLQDQLRESQKMEAIGTLAGGIAHDFNNIIGAILGNAELARQDCPDSPQMQQSLDEILKAGNRARDLVRQILSFSRRQPTTRRVVGLGPIVEESARLLKATLLGGAVLDVSIEEGIPPVLADATQIQQVILNLGTNAFHALRGQSGKIRIALSTVIRDGTTDLIPTHVKLEVTDDGPGIPAEALPRIFEPFFTTKAVGEGTGLGLAVVHGIVAEHDGSIFVSSEPGEGTTFVIHFPVAQAQSEETIPVTRTEIEPGQGQRILHIDDDEALVTLVTRMLTRRGYNVVGFVDQDEALKLLRSNPSAFDLVVTDYNMHGKSGIDVAREVREIRADLPVALASGFITNELREQAAEAGVSELIFKPNTVDEYCASVQRLLANPG